MFFTKVLGLFIQIYGLYIHVLCCWYAIIGKLDLMKPELEQISKEPHESFKFRLFDGEPGCMEDFWHIHPEYEIVYVHNGRGRKHIGTHISRYDDGVLLMLGPNIPHLPLSNEMYRNNYEVVIQFSEEFISDRLTVFPELQSLNELKRKCQSGLSFGSSTRKLVSGYIKPSGKLSPSEKFLMLIRLLVDLSKAEDVTPVGAYGVTSEKAQQDYFRVKEIFDWISSHYQEPIALDQLADTIGLTKNSLCRYFKKITGKTIVDYLNEYRIGVARDYLAQGNLNVNEVLYKCGFNDPSFFYKKFKQIQGCSPRQYQQQFATGQNLHHQKSDHIRLAHPQRQEAHLRARADHSEVL